MGNKTINNKQLLQVVHSLFYPQRLGTFPVYPTFLLPSKAFQRSFLIPA